jgi:hypothetical protein
MRQDLTICIIVVSDYFPNAIRAWAVGTQHHVALKDSLRNGPKGTTGKSGTYLSFPWMLYQIEMNSLLKSRHSPGNFATQISLNLKIGSNEATAKHSLA